MNTAQKYIAVDCERMKYPHTGLYHFCKNLGKALVQQVSEEQIGIAFYVPPAFRGYFGNGAEYLTQRSIHKIAMPSLKHIRVWHATHQSTLYYPYRKKIPVVLTVHDLNFLYDEEKSKGKQKAYIGDLQKKVNRADRLVAISGFTAQELQRHVDIGNKKISVIYNGCNIEEGVLPVPPSDHPDGEFLFTIGTIAPKKNLHVLPALLADNHYRLIIAGITQNEHYKQRIISEAMLLGVADRLIFTGAISEETKKWYYANCAAFVFPSIAEGFGLPVAEAMYFGKPVFISNFTSLPEIGGDAAYLFTDFDPANMRTVLQKGMEDHRMNNRTEKIKARASFFNWETAAKQYLEVYAELV